MSADCYRVRSFEELACKSLCMYIIAGSEVEGWWRGYFHRLQFPSILNPASGFGFGMKWYNCTNPVYYNKAIWNLTVTKLCTSVSQNTPLSTLSNACGYCTIVPRGIATLFVYFCLLGYLYLNTDICGGSGSKGMSIFGKFFEGRRK